MKKKSILVAALLSQGLLTFADVNVKVDDLTIAAGETRTVNVKLVGLTDESELTSYQLDVKLPEGLHFKNLDAITTNTDYGWTLIRSFQGDNLPDNAGRFYSYAKRNTNKMTPENIEEKLGEEGILFSFDVVADNDFNPRDAGEIEVNGETSFFLDGDQPAPYTVKGEVNYESGEVTGIYRLLGDKNNKVTVDGELTEETIELTPKHTFDITVELTNRRVQDNPFTPQREDLLYGGDPDIRGLQGVIHLPKGVKIKGEGEVINDPTTNEELYLGNAEEEKDAEGNVIGTKVTFSIFASKAPLRDCATYGIELFQFTLEGDQTTGDRIAEDDEYPYFRERSLTVTIDNFIATRLNDTKRYTLEDVITITVNNPNEVALQDTWNEFGKNLIADYEAKVEAIPGNVNAYPVLTAQQEKTVAAIDALGDEIKKIYEQGALTDADKVEDAADPADNYDLTELIKNAQDQLDILAKETEKAIAKAEEQVKAAKEAIETTLALPAECSKDDNKNQAEGTWQIAEKALEAAIMQAAEDGTQANDNIFDEALKALEEARNTVIKKAEENKENAGVALRENVLPDNCKEDDTQGTYGTAVQNLKDAIQNAIEKGELAWPGIFDELIAALPVAVQDVIDKAEANNALAADAIVDYGAYTEEYTASEEYQEIRENEDVKAAVAAFDAAKDALEAAVEKAEADGTQAKDDIYKDEIDALEAAMQDLKDEIAAKHEIAEANEEEIEDQLAETYTSERDDIFETQEVVAAMEAWEQAKEALEDALQNSKDNGLLADDQYLDENGEKQNLDDLIENVDNKLAELQEALDNANEIADEVDKEILAEEIPEQATDLIGSDDKDGELQKAKVVDPATVTQPEGRISIEDWEGKYEGLLGDLSDLIYGDDGLKSMVEAKKAAYLAGEISLADLRDFIDTTLPEAEEDFKKAAVAFIVDYLKTVQRGDVGGDGRWTTNDYARLRKVILSEEYPTSPAIDEKGILDVADIVFEEGKPDTEKLYEFYRMDINQDGKINVGDAQAALNYTFYGSMLGPVAEARTADKSAETMSATMTGNVIAIDLSSSRQYSAMQLDVVLAEGMSVTAVNASGRTTGYNVASAELANGATRILLTASEAGQAFEGSEGSVLFIEVAGAGQVDFRNIILADLNAGTAEFNLNGVNGGTTGIAGAKTAAEGEKVFNLGGRVMNALKKGVNIIRRADGSSQKVIKK